MKRAPPKSISQPYPSIGMLCVSLSISKRLQYHISQFQSGKSGSPRPLSCPELSRGPNTSDGTSHPVETLCCIKLHCSTADSSELYWGVYQCSPTCQLPTPAAHSPGWHQPANWWHPEEEKNYNLQ